MTQPSSRPSPDRAAEKDRAVTSAECSKAPWRRSWSLPGDVGTCDGCAESKPLVMAYDVDDDNEPWLCAECAKPTDAMGRLADGQPIHYFDCERFNVTDYGTRQGKCDCSATDDLKAVLSSL